MMLSQQGPVRVVVIGYGLIGRQRAEALAGLLAGALVATVDPQSPDPSGLTGVSHYTDVADVPSDSYDAAIIAVPHDRAAQLAADMLERRRAVLIEKPLGISGDQARQLERLASAAPRPSFVGYNYRFLPAVQVILDLLKSERLGRLRNVDLLLGHGGHPKSHESWKLDPARAGGGVLLDPGVHLLDLLLAVAPGVECTDIQATRGFWGTGIEEDVIASFRLEQLLATVRVSHIRWMNTFRLELMGEDGYAVAEGRGGNYGPMELRVGERWAWSKPGAGEQRETEERFEFGSTNQSLRDELEAVLAIWRDGDEVNHPVHPATMTEARIVTELWEQLDRRLP